MDARDDSWRLAARRDRLWLRAGIIRAIRRFFQGRGYLEVETPVRIPAPAPEEHIDAPSSGDWFLQTSPELCMKRLAAAGYAKIFQISKCFRAAERGCLHLPEFTMLEWYRRDADYRDLMSECEELIPHVAGALERGGTLSFRGRTIDLRRPWERISLSEAFGRYARLSLPDALAQQSFDEVMACEVEPRLAVDRPVFLYDYPVELGALARSKRGKDALAERFELYLCGIELANAFSELTDAAEQRRRFDRALRLRLAAGKALSPMPEPFLASLGTLPETAGIALGVDRLVMIFADAEAIDDVVAFTPEML